MAIIPAEEKVFMVSNSTNTIYSGSASLKAMQQWYTMQDVVDSVGVISTPTLQQVTEAGNVSNTGISVSTIDGVSTAITGTSDNVGVYGSADSGIGIQGTSVFGTGGFFVSELGLGVYTYSDSGYGIYANTAAKDGGGVWEAYSDSRVKENVNLYTKGLSEILLINPVTYDYNGLGGIKKSTGHIGVIAQEIKEILPETVSTYLAKLNEEDEEKTDLLTFNGTALTFALINAVKELNEKIKILEAK